MSFERDLIDITVKQFTRPPKLYLDSRVLADRLDELSAQKQRVLVELDVTPERLRSDAQFAELLKTRLRIGEEHLPVKYSTAQQKNVYAFAKNDKGFQGLSKKFPEAEPYVKARLLFKSSVEQTRLERLLTLEGGHFPHVRIPLPVPLLYYGAHTGRFSGRDKINLQNLGRGSVIRKAIVPPEGYKLVVADLAQIEARLTACFAGQNDLLDEFRRGEDVYANFASEHYGFRVTADKHPKERFVGKTGILSLGFQAGYQKFHDTMNYVFDTPITLDEAHSVVQTYRKKYKRISNIWWRLNDMIEFMVTSYGKKELGPVTFQKNMVVLPNGMPIHYHNLSAGEYWDGRKKVKIYGGKMLENIIQALARIIMTTAEVRLARHNRMASLSVHDELVFVVKEENAALIAAVVKSVMEHPVEWMPELPVKCEVNIGDNYGECK